VTRPVSAAIRIRGGSRSDANEIVLIASVCGAAAAMFLGIGSIAVALPAIAVDFGASQEKLQWASNLYPLALAALLLPAGVVADRFGRRRLLVVGLAVLTVGFLIASQARSPDALLVGFAVAGVGSGLGFPSTLATLTGAVSQGRRPLAISVWAAALPIGGLVGVMITGVTVDIASWPWAFGVIAAFAASTLALTFVVAPETRDPHVRRLDVVGAVLSAAAVAALVVGLTEGPTAGWTDLATLAWLMCSVGLWAGFVTWELYTDQPLLDVRLFAVPAFAAATAAMALMFGGLFGLVYLGFQWEAYVLQMRNTVGGFGLAPFALLMLPLALTSTRLAARFGVRRVLAAALTCGVVGAAVIAWSGYTGEYWTFALGAIIFGACTGLSAGPGTDAISSALPLARQGVASAVNDLSRELGATLGIAVSGTAFTTAYRSAAEDRLPVATDPVAAAIHASPGAGTAALASRPGDVPGRYADTIVEATGQGWTAGALVVSAAFMVGLVIFLRCYPRRRSPTG